MPKNTDLLALPYLLPADAPDLSGGLYALAAVLDASNFMRTSIAQNGTVIGQRAMVNGVEYRWDGDAWRTWTWMKIPFATYAAFQNSASAGGATMEANVAGGVLTLNFSVAKNALGIDVAVLQMKPGFRPAADVHGGGSTVTGGGSRFPAAVRMDVNGNVSLYTNTNGAVDYLSGTLEYRVAN